MKKIMYTAAMLTFGYAANAQVGLGTTTPAPSSMLDITSTTQGLLKPRMTTAQRIAIATPAKGLEVFDITTNSPWYFDGTIWVNGNSFISDLRMVGNSGHITQDAGFGADGTSAGTGFNNIGIGNWSLKDITTGGSNVAVGNESLSNVTSGSGNVALGPFALQHATTSDYNTAVGYDAMASNVMGYGNTAVGNIALRSNTGNQNTVVGQGSLTGKANGNSNTAIGSNAGSNLTSGNYNIAIGESTEFPSSTGNQQLNIGNVIYGTYIGFTGNTDTRIGISTTAPTSTLHVNGSFSTNIVNVNADYTVLDNDYTILVDTSAGDITLSLPTASADNKGRIYNMINSTYAGGTGGIIVNNVSDRGQGIGTFNSRTNAAIAIFNFTLQSDGNIWYIINIGGL